MRNPIYRHTRIYPSPQTYTCFYGFINAGGKPSLFTFLYIRLPAAIYFQKIRLMNFYWPWCYWYKQLTLFYSLFKFFFFNNDLINGTTEKRVKIHISLTEQTERPNYVETYVLVGPHGKNYIFFGRTFFDFIWSIR